ncbi:MAG: 4Fe-4S dicluster domain-containing protein [Armatimonadetes bacterium]|nr:4Fe-4S dicluster domain-containing protein [Armatimonadota bacterium]NIM24059.1 4Fe-4S dicluster domain-containing protein [Armatimonadota bacterium]NIM67913.1 4Fe-4S dicluster domain-containing protein [Armatimonadota bacterium]NIM76435.1 4Fe-4S dicluster domain-containing protein [Armatimonadota bacterium]NIN06143.1 4Fe-4S dicluster domain-containing protein [Armatimonadota bacterium]
MKVAHKVVLHFPPAVVEQPVIYILSRDYNLAFNILKATISQQEEGIIVLELSGEDKDFKRASKYLKKQGIRLQPLLQDIRKNEDKCVHCGLCIAVCPTDALLAERPSMKVNFNADHCVVCGECVPTCPVRAMELHF